MSFPYKWFLTDGYTKKNNLKVFSTFACGGGSTMGYKLAGFDVIGANDIDPKMAKVYKENHNPKHYYLCDIRELNKKIENKEVHDDLYKLDILDGSPPCSTFSTTGSREKSWNKEKVFREGQAKQRLDDLFFYFIETCRLLKPKVVIAENVKGLILGNAKGYVIQIKQLLEIAGYDVQIFLLNAATMGVPQKRERVFIIGKRKDLKFPKLELKFDEKPILFKEINEGKISNFKDIELSSRKYYEKCLPGKNLASVHEKGSLFSRIKLSNNKVSNTLTAHCDQDFQNPTQRRILTKNELSKIGAFPLDYNFLNIKPGYLIGMSVPPVMMAQVANQVHLQWFKKLI